MLTGNDFLDILIALIMMPICWLLFIVSTGIVFSLFNKDS